MRTGLEMMEWFKKVSVIENFSDPAKAEVSRDRIVVGEFVDTEKPTFEEILYETIKKVQEKG